MGEIDGLVDDKSGADVKQGHTIAISPVSPEKGR